MQLKTQLWRSITLGLVLAFWLTAFVMVVEAAPTPSSETNLHQEGGSATPSAALATMEPFIQSDLQILTGNVQRPNSIFWYEDYLYTSCSGDFTIYKINSKTGETTTYMAGVQNAHTMYIDKDESGHVQVWVPDFQRNTFNVVREGPVLDNLVTDMNSPWGMAVAPDGSFYVTQLRGEDVLHIQRDGTSTVVASGFKNPTGIVVDGEFVYVANNGSARRAIEWFSVTDFTGTAIPETAMKPLVIGLQNTTGVVIGPDRLLYFAYSLGTRGVVGRVDPQLCRDKGGCTNADVEVVLWSEIAAPLAGLTLSPDMRLFVHTMFGTEIYWVQLPYDAELIQSLTQTPAP
jgi:hypothetical protein